MKKSIFYSLFVFVMAVCAVGFTSCSDDDEDSNFYTFQISSEHFTDGNEDALSLDETLVDNAISKEFNGRVIGFKGSKDACDKEAISRFNKACESVTLKGGWVGEFTISLYSTNEGSMSKLHDKTFSMAE